MLALAAQSHAVATAAPSLPCRSTGQGNCTFFVSSSSPHASDDNAGTDPAKPLATLSGAITGGPGGLRGGDLVLLKRGDVWEVEPKGISLPGCSATTTSECPSHCVCHVATTLPSIHESAASTPARVVIGAYGDAADARPSLHGKLEVGSAVLRGVDIDGVTFESLEVWGAEAGITLSYTQRSGRYTAGLSIRDCDFHDIQWADFAPPGKPGNITVIYAHGNAIELRNPAADDCQTPGAPCPTPVVVGLEITNSIFERVDMAFSTRVARCGLPQGVREGVATEGTRIHGNLFLNCSFNTVMVDGAKNYSLQHNVFLRGQPRVVFGYGNHPRSFL